ncbi:hypothetical protein BI347_20910 [Chromobacterium sphagni]|uniref:DUF1705 domain-containing protein n=1 Tax=Chromobacterium sphagni TaxID=1903179 RepID=A0A1S1WSG5_9NEIS|nr:hypothetical protein [Chromobacterium sphagni]OHX10259.1 hypothetical protein BI347_20910 [Chromobacterium sphagni]
MKDFALLFFTKWGLLNDTTWMGIFNLLVIPLFALGMMKRVWTSKAYRIAVLALFAVCIVCSFAGFYFVAQPPA